MSARCTIMVLAVAISRPDSMMVVESSTSQERSRNALITSSSCVGGSCPCATATFTSGTCVARNVAISGRSLMRGTMKKLWPPR